jgi:hypothetical protein
MGIAFTNLAVGPPSLGGLRCCAGQLRDLCQYFADFFVVEVVSLREVVSVILAGPEGAIFG